LFGGEKESWHLTTKIIKLSCETGLGLGIWKLGSGTGNMEDGIWNLEYRKWKVLGVTWISEK